MRTREKSVEEKRDEGERERERARERGDLRKDAEGIITNFLIVCQGNVLGRTPGRWWVALLDQTEPCIPRSGGRREDSPREIYRETRRYR